VAAEVVAGRPSAFDARAIPAVVDTDPQIAWCGLTETEARRTNRPMFFISAGRPLMPGFHYGPRTTPDDYHGPMPGCRKNTPQ
jgi:hypothetical protein